MWDVIAAMTAAGFIWISAHVGWQCEAETRNGFETCGIYWE